ncbi:hypothetical protein JYU12_01515 [bacterium AH-315-K03]|nr:hypothetical protein [bacterium AH-315-K03]
MTMAVEIEKNSKSLVEYITILKRRKKQMIQACIITLLLTALVLVVWPFTYRASATLLIEEQNAPSYLNQSTINDYAKQKIQITTQRIIALKNIKELVEKNETYNKDNLPLCLILIMA